MPCCRRVGILDYIWNRQIELKKQNKSVWVFVDSIDVLFHSDQGAAFITDYAKKMNALQNVFTGVAQSSVRMFTDSGVSYRLEDFLQTLGYFKLLNHDPIERRKYMDILNIPGSLVNFMAGAELGRSIILTQSANYSFDDVLTIRMVHEFGHFIDEYYGNVADADEWRELYASRKNDYIEYEFAGITRTDGNAYDMDYATTNRYKFFACSLKDFYCHQDYLRDAYPDIYVYFVGLMGCFFAR